MLTKTIDSDPDDGSGTISPSSLSSSTGEEKQGGSPKGGTRTETGVQSANRSTMRTGSSTPLPAPSDSVSNNDGAPALDASTATRNKEQDSILSIPTDILLKHPTTVQSPCVGAAKDDFDKKSGLNSGKKNDDDTPQTHNLGTDDEASGHPSAKSEDGEKNYSPSSDDRPTSDDLSATKASAELMISGLIPVPLPRCDSDKSDLTGKPLAILLSVNTTNAGSKCGENKTTNKPPHKEDLDDDAAAPRNPPLLQQPKILSKQPHTSDKDSNAGPPGLDRSGGFNTGLAEGDSKPAREGSEKERAGSNQQRDTTNVEEQIGKPESGLQDELQVGLDKALDVLSEEEEPEPEGSSPPPFDFQDWIKFRSQNLDSSTLPKHVSNDFATKKFRWFLSSSQLHEFMNQRGVMVVGLTRVGKSSAVLVQRGSNLSRIKREFVPDYKKGDPIVSGSAISKTINVGVYDDHRRVLKYFDTAGLDENRGEAFKIWTHFSLMTARSLLSDLRATLVVINFRTTFEGTGSANVIRELAKLMSTSCGGAISEDYFSNMCFLITNVRHDDHDLDIIPYVFNLYEAELRTLIRTLKGLEARVGTQGMVCKTRNQAGKLWPFQDKLTGGYFDLPAFSKRTERVDEIFAKASRALRSINSEGLNELPDSDSDKQMLMQVTASTRMLQAILQAGSERLALSYPNGETLCNRQRAKIDGMVEHCKTIQHSELVGMTSGGSLEVFGILAHISRQLTNQLQDLCQRGNQLLSSLSEEGDKVKAIDMSWQGYKQVLLNQIESKLVNLRGEAQRIQGNILSLKSSMDLIAPPRYIYNVRRSASWGNWFGIGRVQEKLTHSGPFVNYSIDQGGYDSCEVVDKSDNQVTLEFKGEWRSALRAQIKFFLYRKDTDEARSQIEVWEQRKDSLNKEIAALEKQVLMIETCEKKEALLEVVALETTTRAQAYAESCMVFNKKESTTVVGMDDKDAKVSPWQVCIGLYNLYDALQVRRALEKDMQDSGLREVSDRFCEAFAEVVKLQAALKANSAAKPFTDDRDGVDKWEDCAEPAEHGFDVYQTPVPSSSRQQTEGDEIATGRQTEEVFSDAVEAPPEAKSDLSSWLKELRVSEKGAQALSELAAHSIEDVATIVNECEDMLEGLPKLDAHKIKKAVRQLGDAQE